MALAMDYSSVDNTPIEHGDFENFLDWVKKQSELKKRDVSNDDVDYDLQGLYRSQKDDIPNNHDPDTFKKPNHPTFSTDSKYNDPTFPGGQWDGNTFTPSDLNLITHSPKELQDYFDQVEPSSLLRFNNIKSLLKAPNESKMRDNLFPGEEQYFKNNPNVGGMAAEDGKVILNPYSNLLPEEKQKVAQNELARLYLRNNNINLNFPLTEKQKSFFNTVNNGAPYGSENDIRSTILGRLVSGDASAQDATDEQRKLADQIRGKLGIHDVIKPTNQLVARSFLDKTIGDEKPEEGDDSMRDTVSPIDFIPYSGVAKGARGILGNEIGAIGKTILKPEPPELEAAYGQAEKFSKLMSEKFGPQWDEIIKQSEDPGNKRLLNKWLELVHNYQDALVNKFKPEMSDASRLARANQMGFNTNEVMYHSTPFKFNEFEPGSDGLMHFGTQTQAEAIKKIAPNANWSTVPVHLKVNNPLEVRDYGFFEANKIANELAPKGVITEEEQKAIQSLPQAEAQKKLIDVLKSKGYDSLKYRNIHEVPSGGWLIQDPIEQAKELEKLGDYSYAVFDPNQIRHVNASFDPSKASSADIMAGLGGGALLGASQNNSQEQRFKLLKDKLGPL